MYIGLALQDSPLTSRGRGPISVRSATFFLFFPDSPVHIWAVTSRDIHRLPINTLRPRAQPAKVRHPSSGSDDGATTTTTTTTTTTLNKQQQQNDDSEGAGENPRHRRVRAPAAREPVLRGGPGGQPAGVGRGLPRRGLGGPLRADRGLRGGRSDQWRPERGEAGPRPALRRRLRAAPRPQEPGLHLHGQVLHRLAVPGRLEPRGGDQHRQRRHPGHDPAVLRLLVARLVGVARRPLLRGAQLHRGAEPGGHGAHLLAAAAAALLGLRGGVPGARSLPSRVHVSHLVPAAVLLVADHPGLRRLLPAPLPEGHAVRPGEEALLLPAGVVPGPPAPDPPQHYQELHARRPGARGTPAAGGVQPPEPAPASHPAAPEVPQPAQQDARARAALPLPRRGLRPPLLPLRRADAPHPHPHRPQALPVPDMHAQLQPQRPPDHAHPDAHGREAVRLRLLRPQVRPERREEAAHQDPPAAEGEEVVVVLLILVQPAARRPHEQLTLFHVPGLDRGEGKGGQRHFIDRTLRLAERVGQWEGAV